MDFSLHLVPLIPLVAAGINLLIGRKLPRDASSLLAVGAVAASAVIATVGFWQIAHEEPSGLIHIYSIGYMSHERDYARYFGYLNLFTGAMLLLVLGDNLLVSFVGWEGVGVCSYLLIGFWYDKEANAY